jgi:hypothetical protein
MYEFIYPRTQEFYLILFFIFILIIIVFFAVSFLREKSRKEVTTKKDHLYYKEKQLGLSILEVKILDILLKELDLKGTGKIVNNPELFEKGLVLFFQRLEKPALWEHLKIVNNSAEALAEVIVSMHSKLYTTGEYPEPLEEISNMARGAFLCLVMEKKYYLTGKFEEVKDNSIEINLFQSPKSIREFANKEVLVVFLRKGDSKYSFVSRVSYVGNRIIRLFTPDSFKRGNETKLPVKELFLSCLVTYEVAGEPDNKKFVKGIIKEFRSTEADIKSETELPEDAVFYIKLDFEDLTIHLKARLIPEKSKILDQGFFYTFELLELSDTSKSIIMHLVSKQTS